MASWWTARLSNQLTERFLSAFRTRRRRRERSQFWAQPAGYEAGSWRKHNGFNFEGDWENAGNEKTTFGEGLQSFGNDGSACGPGGWSSGTGGVALRFVVLHAGLAGRFHRPAKG